MVRIIFGVLILILSVVATIGLSIWALGTEFGHWWDEWLVISGITFLLGVGIVIAGLLFEMGLRSRNNS